MTGERKIHSREVSNFDRISLRGIGNLAIEPGDRESLTVEASARALPYIVTEVKDGKLILSQKRPGLPWRSAGMGRIDYAVTVKELNGVEIAGAGTVNGSRLFADRFDLLLSGTGKVRLEVRAREFQTRLSGSGNIRLSGEAEHHKVVISGSGRYAAEELISQVVQITVSGAAEALVHAAGQLDATITGSGKVFYTGNPTVKKRISGVGQVSQLS